MSQQTKCRKFKANWNTKGSNKKKTQETLLNPIIWKFLATIISIMCTLCGSADYVVQSFLVSCLFHHKPDDVQSSATYKFKYIYHCPFRCDKTVVPDFYNTISWFCKCHLNFPHHYCVYTHTITSLFDLHIESIVMTLI